MIMHFGGKRVTRTRYQVSHCYFTRLNPIRISPLRFCLPKLLGIHRNPRQKDGAGLSLRHFLDKFDFSNGTFMALQMKSFDFRKKSNYMQGLKSAILAIFQTGPGWSCPVSTALKNPSQDFKNSFCIGCR